MTQAKNSNHLYLCDWTRVGRSYKVWLIDDPSVSAIGESLAECQAAMWEMFAEKMNDPEGVLEFANEHPAIPFVFSRPEIRAIGPDSAINPNTPLVELFSGAICGGCGLPQGERSSTPITVVQLPEKGDAAQIAKIGRMAYSEQLLRALGVLDSVDLEFRPIHTIARFPSRRVFLEPIAKSAKAALRPVAVKGYEEHYSAWKCKKCGAYDVLHELEEELIRCVAAGGLTTPSLLRGELCVTGKAWRAARNLLGLKGVGTQQVGVVADDLCISMDHVRFEMRDLSERVSGFPWPK